MLNNKRYESLKYVILGVLVYLGLSVIYPTQNINRFLAMSNLQNQLLVLVLLILFSALVHYSKNIKLSLISKIVNCVFAFGYGILIVLARSYETRQNLSLIWANSHDVIYSIISWVAYSIFTFYVIKSLIKFFREIEFDNLKLNKGNWLKFFLIACLVLMLLWLPYFIISLPGLVSYDGMEQIDELFRVKAVDGQFVLTNHHPVFPTLIEGLWLKIGLSVFHSLNVGILINSIFLNLITIFSFSYLITIIAIFYSRKNAIYLLVFYGLFPVFPQWANALDKTGYFSAACSFFIASLLVIIEKKKTFKKDYLLLGLSAILLGLIRNDGFLYVILALIGSFTLKKNKARKTVVSLFTSCILMMVGFKVLTYASGALPTEPMESLAIPIQSVTRVVKYRPARITKPEKHQLSEFFYYSKMRKNYDPEFGDVSKFNSKWPYRKFKGSYRSLKNQFDQQPWVKNKRAFLKLWWEIGKRNPKLYLEAIVAQNYYYFFPQSRASHYGWLIGPMGPSIVRTRFFNNYKLLHSDKFNSMIDKLMKLSSIPVIGLLFLTFVWFIVWSSTSLVLIDKQQYQYLSIILVGLSVVLVALISPLNGFLRYYYPLMIIDPVLLVLLGCHPRNEY